MTQITKAGTETASSRTATWRTASSSAVLGAFSVALPHFGLLLFTNTQTFFQRETTLWITCVLLMGSALYLGFSRQRRWLHAVAMIAGATAAVVLYLLVTVDLGGTQFYGAISPRFLWLVAVATSVLIMLPVVVLGVATGRAVNLLWFTKR